MREPMSSSTMMPSQHRHAVRGDALHHAVDRDLRRLEQVLGEPVTAVRRQAIIGHVTFLLDQLAAQHRLLDQEIWPGAAMRRPELADLVERVQRSHAELQDVVDRVRSAAAEWSGSPRSRAGLLTAVRELAEQVGPVLDQDAELLPLACAALESADWSAIERRRPREVNPTRLARRTFWLLDELDPAQSALLLERMPPAAMWILRNGFSGAYNRGSYLMWVGGGTGPAI